MSGKSETELGGALQKALSKTYPGMTVEVGSVDRWERSCITVRWDGFAGLLPEERFHRIVKVLPENLRDKALKGHIWLELAPEESIDAFLKLPRSEDVAGREQTIHGDLAGCGFYDALAEAMGSSPQKTCGGDFSRTIASLKKLKATEKKQRDARLLFIKHGAFCDCQVVETIRPQLEKTFAKSR